MAASDSQRTNAILALQAALQAIAPITPAPADPLDQWPFKFTSVNLGPLGEPDFKKAYICGIVPGRETKVDKYPIKEATLQLSIEFQATSNQGGPKPALLAELVLTAIQRAIHADTTLGGTVVDTQEVGNEIDLETYGDKSVVGVVFVEMKYRHFHSDPRKL